jgi:PAS domain S-box-containing protein
VLDLTKLFSYSRDLGFITDLRGAILAATAGSERALGYSQAEMAGLDLPHLDESGDLQRFFGATPVRSRMNLGFHLRTKSGAMLTIGAMASSLRDETGAPVAWFIAGQDLRGAVAEARGARPILDALMDSIGAALWSFDRNGTVITWSRACEPAFGVPRDEAEGKLSAARLFPSPGEFRRVVEAVDREGGYSGEIALLGRDGSVRPNHISVTPLVADGLAVGYSCVSFDIAERKRVEEFQRILFDQAGEAILVVELLTRLVVDANARACEMHGFSREEFLSLHVPDFLPPEEIPRMGEIGGILGETGKFDGQQVLRRKDGSVFPCALNLRTVEVGDRKLVVCVYRDLTEQLKAQEFFRVLFEKASDAVYLVADEGLRVVEANEAACRLLGYTREEFLRLRVVDLVPPPFRHRIAEFHESVRTGPGYRRDRRMAFRKDGSMVATDQAVSRVEISGKPYYIASCRDLTEQERAARELEEAKAFLEHVQENAGDGLALLDENGFYVAVNQKLLEMRGGARREEILGTPWMERATPERMEGYRHYWDRLMKGERISMRTTIERPPAPSVIVDVSSALILRGDSKFVFAIVRDVTDQVKAEEELRRSREDLERHVAERTVQLRESEEKFRGAFAQGGIGMALVGPDGRFLQVNRSLCDMLGYEEGELLATTFQAITHPEDQEKSADLARRMARGGSSSARIEKRYLHRRGQVVWTDLSTTLIRDAGGAPLYFVTTIQDITERKRAEEELRESEGRFRSITEGVPVAVVIARTSDGTILYANETAADSLGLAHGAVEGRKIPEFLARPRDREEVRDRLRREGFIRDLELQFRTVEGTLFWGVSSLRLATYRGEAATLGVFSDITARKQAEEMLKKGHEELERRVAERTTELARANALLQEEIAERKRAEHALRLILEGTAALTGGSFFRPLARHLASALNVRYAAVVQGLGRPPLRARTLAFWNGDDLGGPLEYDLAGTPCEDVLAGEACCYSHDVQRLFPELRMLADLGVESYLGVPMVDSSGSVVGHLWVMDVHPVSDEELKLSVLKIFAARAGVELERQLAEEALRDSEERWRSLVANAPDFILTVDRSGCIQSINRTVPGLRIEDTLGKHVFNFTHPDAHPEVQRALEKVFKERQSCAYETRAIGPNGSTAWYATRVGPVMIGNEVAGAMFIATDVTERRRADQRQQVQHAVTQVLAGAASLEEAMPLILQRVGSELGWSAGLMWRVDPDTDALRLAEAWQGSDVGMAAFVETSRGHPLRSGEGLPGRVWKDRLAVWVPDVQRDDNFPRADAARRAGLRAAMAFPVDRPDGVFGVIEFFHGEALEPDEPLLRMAASIGSQIGQFIERKRAEEGLRFQKSLLESQSEAAIDGILVVSRDGVMTSFNRRFCQMWEIPDEILRSRTDERALQSVLDKLVDPKEFIHRVRHLYEHPDEESRDEVHLKDGRVFDRYSAPVKGGDAVLYGRVWYFRDVTGRKQTEENLRRAAEETRQMYEDLKEAQAQLIRSEKLASIGMLVSGVAHEINNPLNVMYGNLQLLAEVSDVLLPLSVEGARAKKVRGTAARVAKFRGMIRDALKAARHAREIVHDFRNFARDTRTAELVDLNQCLEEAVTLIQRELRPGIRVVRRLGRIPQVRCLRGQMSQVFLNLLKNAGESIERKGTVTLRTQQKNGHVQVEVADTGRGMADDIRRKLFEPFFTTKPVGKGLGLGLSISAMIVHNHNGRITVRSHPGRGSVFRVELPLPP